MRRGRRATPASSSRRAGRRSTSTGGRASWCPTSRSAMTACSCGRSLIARVPLGDRDESGQVLRLERGGVALDESPPTIVGHRQHVVGGEFPKRRAGPLQGAVDGGLGGVEELGHL